MCDINMTTIMGRLVRDPELRRGQSGIPFATYTVAVNRKWKDDRGNVQEETAFIPAIAFGRLAEWASEHRKGESVVLIGRLRTDSWEADGTRHSRLVLVVDTQQFVQMVYGGTTSAPDGGDGGSGKRESSRMPF